MAFALALAERTVGPVGVYAGPRKRQRREALRGALFTALNEQIDSALRHVGEAAEPAASDLEVTEAVHEVRKSIKRIRALLRLLRQALGQAAFKAESQSFARMGRALSDTREAQVIDTVLHNLGSPGQNEQATPPPLSPVTEPVPGGVEALAAAQRARRGNTRPAVQRLSSALRDQLLHELAAARTRLARRSLRSHAERSLDSGLRRAVRRARQGWKVARAPSSLEQKAEHFHELRKRVKDLYYMATLLAPAQPQLLGDLGKRLNELADLLGDDHDLTSLAERAHAQPDEFGGTAVVTPLLQLAAQRQQTLRAAAKPLAELLLTLKPRRFASAVATGLRQRLG